MKKQIVLIILLLLPVIVGNITKVKAEDVRVQASNGLDVGIESPSIIYVLENHVIVANATHAYLDGTIVNASDVKYLPYYKMFIILNNQGIWRYQDGSLTLITGGQYDGIEITPDQKYILAWYGDDAKVIDLSGTIIQTYSFDRPVKHFLPYVRGYEAVILLNDTVYYYTDIINAKLKYTRTHPDIATFDYVVLTDIYGKHTIVAVNDTDIIIWAVEYSYGYYYFSKYAFGKTITPEGLFVYPYNNYYILTWSQDTLILLDRNRDMTEYTFSNIAHAYYFVGYKNLWAYPMIVVTGDHGIRIMYYDYNKARWDFRNIVETPVNSAITIVDNDTDKIPEIYFVQDGVLKVAEFQGPSYIYDYRAVYPLITMWMSKSIILYDRGASDWDGDKIDNSRELNELKTSILLTDTDHDGLGDYDEAVTYGTDPANPDTDHDGLNDYDEVIVYHTNALKEDTDGDGIPDGEEVNTYGTDPLSNDTDHDGIIDSDEIMIFGTNPTDKDTDGDGIKDGEEVKMGLNPANNDTDGDGIMDSVELYEYGTDPKNPDTDGDGLTDYQEINVYKTDPKNPDTDGDGYRDGAEVDMGFDPTNVKSNPESIYYAVHTWGGVFTIVFMMGLVLGMAIITMLWSAHRLRRSRTIRIR